MYDLMRMDEVTWSYIVLALAVFPWLVYLFMAAFFTLSISYGRLKLHHKTDANLFVEDLPGVSIVKPLLGVDPLLEVNLESHFTLTYPKFELLICIEDDEDPAINLARKLMDRHPKVDCQLFVGGKDGILNPMVRNMCPGYEAAKYPIVWVSTSRILASTDILNDMIGKLQNPKVALVHQMPFTTDQTGLSAAVEKVYFGAAVGRFFLAFHMLGISCFTGMSYLVKKHALDELGGLAWFGKFLAEDFFIAKLLREKGYRHQLCAIPAQQNVAGTSVAGYKDRMVRWTRLRLNMMPITGGILEPLCESIILGIYASWSVHYLFGLNPYAWFCGHWAIWCLLDYIQLKGIQNGPLPFSTLTFLVAWVIRELLFIFVYFEAVINVRRIKWGKRTYRLSNFGESLEIVSDKSILPI